MILSVSRRTDIPAFYSEWFMNRLQEGFVYVKNPMNANQVSSIPLNPEVVDCIVFWTKNPAPLMPRLEEMDRMGYSYYFQFTITPYDQTMERNLPDKKVIMETFMALSNRIGKDRVVWRYDPIVLNDKFHMDFHMRSFKEMLVILADYTNECIISFVDPYRKTKLQMGTNFTREMSNGEMIRFGEGFSSIAEEHSSTTGKPAIRIKTCAEKIDLEEYGIQHASCIDRHKIESIIGCPLTSMVKKDGQRPDCGCMECIDIGTYNTCVNGCSYCYATFNQQEALRNYKIHDPKSPILVGDAKETDKVTHRKVVSFRENQISLI